MTKKQFNGIKLGTWVRVVWTDVGAQDGILVGKGTQSTCEVFFPFEGVRNASYDIISEVGDCITAKYSGLK